MARKDFIKQAATMLSEGKLVALPSETVYGLCADAHNERALEHLLRIKRRPKGQPISIFIEKIDDMADWANDIPSIAYQLAEQYWPGPLTLILKAAPHVSHYLTGDTPNIGLRVPHHPLTIAVLKQVGHGLAAPSANRAGEKSPSCAQDVIIALDSEVDFILDGGPCKLGSASTIVDVTGRNPKILRKGAIVIPGLIREIPET